MKSPKSDNITLYRPADKYVGVNVGDVDLVPIWLELPDPPNIEHIDGYGLHPDEQYFKRPELPRRLEIIERDVYDKLRQSYSRNANNTITVEKVIDLFWDTFNEKRDDYYLEEIYIKKIHYYRTYGYWFFNDGKPTYLPPDYFDFLNFWTLQDGDIPEYRDKDRRKYLFWQYLETTTETFVKLDYNGFGEKVDGRYEMMDVGARVFFGGVEPKTRRSGATHQACHKLKTGVESRFGGFSTIVSMDGDNAGMHFAKKLLPALQKYPIFMRSKWDGNNTSNAVKYRTRNQDQYNPPLGGTITYTESAGETKNDGDEIHYLLSDEEGKCPNTSIDIVERWNVNKKAMSKGLGSTIMGFALHPSTVETMNAGGISYRKLADLSNFYQRIDGTGQTVSGLSLLFFAAQDGAENFIDRFGMSVIDKPTERQIKLRPDALYAKMKIGSFDYMMNLRKRLLVDGSPKAMEQYRSIRRKEPMNYAECWIGTAGDMGFNLEKIDQRLMELKRSSKMIKGNFKWKNDVRDSEVVFVPDSNGRWEVSMTMAPTQANLKEKSARVYNPLTKKWEWHWKPKNFNKFTLGVDPFGYTNKTESKQREDNSRQSNGGMAVLKTRDQEVDLADDPNMWTTRRFICSYSYRPASTYDFNEDMLMTAVYYGSSIYMERNKTNSWEYLIVRGYGGYMQYDVEFNGKVKDKPGAYASEDTMEELLKETKDYINYHCGVEEHASYLEECKNIRGREEITKYDRFAGHGWAIVGDKRKTGGLLTKMKEKEQHKSSLSSVIRVLTG